MLCKVIRVDEVFQEEYILRNQIFLKKKKKKVFGEVLRNLVFKNWVEDNMLENLEIWEDIWQGVVFQKLRGQRVLDRK